MLIHEDQSSLERGATTRHRQNTFCQWCTWVHSATGLFHKIKLKKLFFLGVTFLMSR